MPTTSNASQSGNPAAAASSSSTTNAGTKPTTTHATLVWSDAQLVSAVVTLACSLAHHVAARVPIARALRGLSDGIARPTDSSALATIRERALALIDQLDDADDSD